MRLLFLVFLLVLSACVVNRLTGKRSFVLVSDDVMNQLGAQSYQDVKAKSQISSNPRWTEISRRAALRVAKASEENFNWEFTLVESKEANAFALPGGKIMVYTGILPPAQNEAALAFVLGHEVGHAIARHGAQRISQGLIAEGALVAADLMLARENPNRDLIMAGLGLGAEVGVMLPFSRAHESEADYMGIIYMARAGYDPAEAAKFWTRMGQGQVKPPEFLSTHPSDDRRARDLLAVLPTAQDIYLKAPVKYGSGEPLP